MIAATVENQAAGLGVMIAVAAIVIGYVVWLLVPKNHFAATAGILASNAFVGGLAYWGVEVAAAMLIWWVMLSVYLGLRASLDVDTNSN